MKSRQEQKLTTPCSREPLLHRNAQPQCHHPSLNPHPPSPSSPLKQQCLLLQRECHLLETQVQTNKYHYDKELEHLAVLQQQNDGLVKRKRLLMKRLDEMEGSLQGIRNQHKERVGEILDEINRWSEKTGEKRKEGKLEDLQGELQEFKIKITNEEQKEKKKFGQEVATLQRLQAQRQQLAQQVECIRRIQFLMAPSKQNLPTLPVIFESQSHSFCEEAKLCMQALLQ